MVSRIQVLSVLFAFWGMFQNNTSDGETIAQLASKNKKLSAKGGFYVRLSMFTPTAEIVFPVR